MFYNSCILTNFDSIVSSKDKGKNLSQPSKNESKIGSIESNLNDRQTNTQPSTNKSKFDSEYQNDNGVTKPRPKTYLHLTRLANRSLK